METKESKFKWKITRLWAIPRKSRRTLLYRRSSILTNFYILYKDKCLMNFYASHFKKILFPSRDIEIFLRAPTREKAIFFYVGYLWARFDFFQNRFVWVCVPILVTLIPNRTRWALSIPTIISHLTPPIDPQNDPKPPQNMGFPVQIRINDDSK
jgi:hypothetical protein